MSRPRLMALPHKGSRLPPGALSGFRFRSPDWPCGLRENLAFDPLELAGTALSPGERVRPDTAEPGYTAAEEQAWRNFGRDVLVFLHGTVHDPRRAQQLGEGRVRNTDYGWVQVTAYRTQLRPWNRT